MPLIETQEGKKVVPVVINDKALPVDSSHLLPVKNPASGDTVHYSQGADVATCTQAVDAAWTAFQSWKRSSVNTRRDLLFKMADLMEQRKDQLIDVQMQETQCPKSWALNNVNTTAAYAREIAACISQACKGEIPPIDKPDTLAFVYKEAVGPVLIIPPWNAALVLAGRALCTAIGAGCTVVLKSSELSPLTHTLLADCFRDAGMPSGVLNSLSCARQDAAEATEAMIAHPAVRKIEFIGSAVVGRIIGSVAAKHLKPVLMELGGKCPAIVLDDADLQKAARLCIMGVSAYHDHPQVVMLNIFKGFHASWPDLLQHRTHHRSARRGRQVPGDACTGSWQYAGQHCCGGKHSSVCSRCSGRRKSARLQVYLRERRGQSRTCSLVLEMAI